jgi:hypothetical protein
MEERDHILLARMDERQKHMDEKIDTLLKMMQKTNDRIDGHDDDIQALNEFKGETIGFFKGSWKTVSAVAGAAAIVVTLLIELVFKK